MLAAPPSAAGLECARRKSAAQRRRARDRRFVPETKRRWFERMCALKRIRQELRKHGVLVQMQLSLRDGLPAPVAIGLVESFRRAGFVAYGVGQLQVLLTGEPCLALAFIDRAASAGVLSRTFRDSLDELYDGDVPRPAARMPKALRPVGKLFDAIVSVDMPCPRAARKGLA